MKNKILIITGAGFSAPAKLPIQNAIINEMLSEPQKDFLEIDSVETGSEKFLRLFIDLGLFLIENYTQESSKEFQKKLLEIDEYKKKSQYLPETIKDIINAKDIKVKIKNYIKLFDKDDERKQNFEEIIELIAEKGIVNNINVDGTILFNLAKLKEKIRMCLNSCNLIIDLEDLFTRLDKSVKEHKHWKQYTYQQLDALRHAVLRLFIYYFGEKDSAFALSDSYINYAAYIEKNQKNIAIITTNWDTINERILDSKNVNYDLCFNDSLYFENEQSFRKKSKLKIAKVHGSINWFSCLNCGSIVAVDKNSAAKHLLSDEEFERCLKCGAKNMPLLVPEIITPTMIKTIDKQIYSNIWQSAEYMLKEATKVIFIGYSLPLADFEFRYLLSKYIDSNAQIDVVLHNNDIPIENGEQNSPQGRYKSAFPKNNINFYYEGFSKYFNSKNNE